MDKSIDVNYYFMHAKLVYRLPPILSFNLLNVSGNELLTKLVYGRFINNLSTNCIIKFKNNYRNYIISMNIFLYL